MRIASQQSSLALAGVILLATHLGGCTFRGHVLVGDAGTDASIECEPIRDIFVPRCALSGCHSALGPAAGLEFESGGLTERLVGVRSNTCPGELIVDPLNPADSFLLQRLGTDPQCGGEAIRQMPAVGPPLEADELACVSRWVESVVNR